MKKRSKSILKLSKSYIETDMTGNKFVLQSWYFMSQNRLNFIYNLVWTFLRRTVYLILPKKISDALVGRK
jgi:hypothetical protein